MATEYRSFRDFYPDYLAEHRNPVSRRLHFAGTLADFVLFRDMPTGQVPWR